MSSNPSIHLPAAIGGLSLVWLLADDPRAVQTKAGKTMTVVELRDPTRLANSLVLWVEGAVSGVFEQVPPRTPIALHVPSVRSGRGRGELIASVSRESLEAAFTRALEGVKR